MTVVFFVSNKKVIDRPIQPSFPEKKYSRTVRRAAAHLGEIRDYYEKSLDDEIFLQTQYDRSTDALPIFKDDPLAV